MIEVTCPLCGWKCVNADGGEEQLLVFERLCEDHMRGHERDVVAEAEELLRGEA